MPVKYSQAILGSSINVYIDANNNITMMPSDKTIPAYVAGFYVEDGVLVSVLLCWKNEKSAPSNLEYHGKISWKLWKESYPDRYRCTEDIGEYSFGSWVRGVNRRSHFLFCSFIDDDKYGNGPIIPGSAHKLKLPYIKAYEIMPGDTIAWIASESKLNYAVVHDIKEDESAGEEPLVVFCADVYCDGGQRSFPNGYPMGKDCVVLLFNRIVK